MGGHDDAETFLVQSDRSQADGFVHKNRPSEGSGKPAPGHHFPHTFGSTFFEVDRNERETLTIFAEEGAEERLSGRADVAEAEFAFFAGGGAAHAAGDIVNLIQKEANFLEKNRAGWGEADHVTRALKNLRAERTFKLLDGAAQSGLRDVKAFRRFREAQFFGNGLEVAKVAQIHKLGRDRYAKTA